MRVRLFMRPTGGTRHDEFAMTRKLSIRTLENPAFWDPDFVLPGHVVKGIRPPVRRSKPRAGRKTRTL